MNNRNLHYFISDVHLGLNIFEPAIREKKFANFLNQLPDNTASVYFLGDIFDFWFEYKYLIPRGFTRTLGAMANLTDKGVKLFFINGNHDVWTFSYLQNELGVKILKEMTITEIGGVKFCLAHGDELIGERWHNILKGAFKNRLLQMLLSSLHPRWVFAFAMNWSRHNRLRCGNKLTFRGEKDPLFKMAVNFERSNDVDNFIFGHMHTAGGAETPKGAGFYILGEWIYGCEYLLFDSDTKSLKWEKASLCGQ